MEPPPAVLAPDTPLARATPALIASGTDPAEPVCKAALPVLDTEGVRMVGWLSQRTALRAMAGGAGTPA
ncbi:CBS domain-containing protein [Streptomyces sp. NPDC001594]|uniref:CBS domain-containing protein n=1 Tax=Streptomyces sp. NPDC001594 TaxID=3364590 RepID=UPI0036BFFBD1